MKSGDERRRGTGGAQTQVKAIKKGREKRKKAGSVKAKNKQTVQYEFQNKTRI